MPKARAMSSAVLCCGLIEAVGFVKRRSLPPRLPQCYAAASLKLIYSIFACRGQICLPQCYAAASLKRVLAGDQNPRAQSSAVLCCGLIEAPTRSAARLTRRAVFRSVMLRPH